MRRVEIRHRPLPKTGYIVDEETLGELCEELGLPGYTVSFDKDGDITQINLDMDGGSFYAVLPGDIITRDEDILPRLRLETFRPERDKNTFTFRALMK